MTKTTTRTQTQIARINGARVRLVTKDGKVTAKPVAEEEWRLQAAQVRRLRGMSGYGKLFTIAGDQNAARRGPKARMQAVAAGMTAGEHDLRIYMNGGLLGLIENKAGNERPTKAQTDRHGLLAALGFTRQAVINATTEDEAADKAEAAVRGWLAEINAENDNRPLDLVSRIA